VAKVQQSSNRFESAGWLFFGITVAVIIGPFIYLASQVVLVGTPIATVVALGVVMALVVAGLFTAAVNAVLQRAARKRRAAERKKPRK
jgi:uncharacterized membrane protein